MHFFLVVQPCLWRHSAQNTLPAHHCVFGRVGQGMTAATTVGKQHLAPCKVGLYIGRCSHRCGRLISPAGDYRTHFFGTPCRQSNTCDKQEYDFFHFRLNEGTYDQESTEWFKIKRHKVIRPVSSMTYPVQFKSDHSPYTYAGLPAV